jgi:hypothetical protein
MPLLVLRHENAALSRQVGRVRNQPGDRLWLAALSRLIPQSARICTPESATPCGGNRRHIGGSRASAASSSLRSARKRLGGFKAADCHSLYCPKGSRPS